MILIETQLFKVSPKQLTEGTKSSVGNPIVEGILTTAEVKNGNGRYYPKELWEREINKYMECVRENRALGELDHPDSSIINLKNVSHNIRKIWWQGDNVLGQIVDFSIMLQTDEKNINAFIVYDDDNYWPLDLTSGMERFISSLAIRSSLINITSLPKPNCIAIDEGFTQLDAENMGQVYLLFNYLKTQFDFMMVISHIDVMRDMVEHFIDIKKEDGFSKVSIM